MILKDVNIRDFRSHERTIVKFDEGISVIVGDNGSGKTSILESINFALFKQKPNVNVDDLIRRGADSTEVSVTFTANGRTFRATRGRKIGKAYGSALYQIEDGEVLLVKGEDEITKEIEGILGIGGELFTSAVYIKQGEIDRLVTDRPAERKEHIGKLLGTGELERAHHGMGELLRDFERRVSGLGHPQEDIKEMENDTKEKKESIQTLKGELKKSSKISVSIKKELKDNQSQLKDLEKLRELKTEEAELDIRLKNLKEKIWEIEEHEKEYKKTQGYNNRYALIEKEIKSLEEKGKKLYAHKQQKETLARELKIVNKTLLTLNSAILDDFESYSGILGRKFVDIEKLEKQKQLMLKRLETGTERIDKKIKSTSIKISSAREKNIEIEKAVFELERAKALCPVCRGPLDKKHKKELLLGYAKKREKNLKDVLVEESSLLKLQIESRKIAVSLKGCRNINVELLKSQIENQDDIEKRIEKIKSGLDVNEEALIGLSKIELALNKKEKEKSALKEKNDRFIAAKSYLRKYLPELDDFRAGAKSIEKQCLKLEKKAKVLGGPLDLKKFEKMKQEESELQDKFRDVKVTEGRLEADVSHIKNEITEYEKRLIELKQKEKEREKLAKFLVFLKDIRGLFHKDSLQKSLRTKAMPLIEAYTKEIFDMFDLPYNDLELTSDFNVMLYGPHGQETVDMLSGGERIASALALRIGIAKALSGQAMELIILDEPTIHLDSQRRLDLVEIIKKLSSIPQTIVVTHDKEFEQAADRLVVLEKVDGISRIS